jgi:hypothetical protein
MTGERRLSPQADGAAEPTASAAGHPAGVFWEPAAWCPVSGKLLRMGIEVLHPSVTHLRQRRDGIASGAAADRQSERRALSVIVCNTRGSKLSMPAKTESQVQRFRHAAAGALFGSFKHLIEKAEQ